MDYPQLIRMTALTIWGFIPDWAPPTLKKLEERIKSAGTIPAVYLRTVSTNKDPRTPGRSLAFPNVILSPKWDQFLEEELQTMKREASVKFDSDVVEFRSALVICRGDYRAVLEDGNFNISDLGRNRLSLMYGYPDIAETCLAASDGDALANPFFGELYDKLQEDANVKLC